MKMRNEEESMAKTTTKNDEKKKGKREKKIMKEKEMNAGEATTMAPRIQPGSQIKRSPFLKNG